MDLADACDNEPAWLADRARRHLDAIRVLPEILGLQEIDAVLGPVRRALPWVELELHDFMV